MTKTLLLLRHANATEADASTDDYDRALSAKGLEECAVTAAALTRLAEPLDAVHVSSARRTRQTAEAMIRSGVLASFRVQYEEGLYLATTGDMFHRVQKLPDTVRSVLFVAHNPGIGELVSLLAAQVNPDFLRYGMPTCGLVRLTYAGECWADMAAHDCRMTHFFSPLHHA
jgi:phosphohistidine phosphatase